MRTIAFLFALVLSVPAFACDAIPADMKFKTLTGELMTLTGNLTMKVDFVDLETAECTADRNAFQIKEGATISVLNGARSIQSFKTTVTYLNNALYLSKPANMVMGGVEVNKLSNGTVVMFYDGAAMRPAVTL